MDAETYSKDCIGEDTDPSDCALCHAISCFSCVQDYCTALEKITVGGCVFYKDAAQNRKEIRRCFYRLISRERFDLLRKYADTMAALGLMDEELADAELQRKRLGDYQSQHLSSLLEAHWKDTLVVVCPVDEVDDMQDDTSDVEPQESEDEPEYDNSVEQAVFPEGIAVKTLDDETAEDIETRDRVLQEEVKPENYHMYDVLHDANVRAVTDSGEDELPEDYSEDDEDEIDEDNPVDEDGNPISYDEYIEREQEKEREKEAEKEIDDQRTQKEYDNQADGTEAYVAVPLNFFYGTVGFPIRIPMPPDPVDVAYRMLGAGMVYKAAEDYIRVLRMLWSGDYQSRAQYRLIVDKWELETLIGSRWYWQFTNISPNRMLDQCRATAEEQAREKIERFNRRIAAGIESGEEA